MPAYDVYFRTFADTIITVNSEKDLDSEEIIELAYRNGDFPQICAQCSGWNQTSTLELGADFWEPTYVHGGVYDFYEVS